MRNRIRDHAADLFARLVWEFDKFATRADRTYGELKKQYDDR